MSHLTTIKRVSVSVNQATGQSSTSSIILLVTTILAFLTACGSGNKTTNAENIKDAITIENYIDVIGLVLEVYNGNAYREEILLQPVYSDSTYQQLPTGNPDNWTGTNNACINAGSSIIEPIAEYDGFRNYTSGWDFLFENCQDNTVLVNGQIQREYLGGGASQWQVTANELSVSGSSRQLNYTGVAVLFGGGRSAEWQRSWEAIDLDYSLSNSESSLQLIDVNTEFFYYTSLPLFGSAGMDGSFGVISNVTGDSAVMVNVLQAFGLYLSMPLAAEDAPWHFETGILEVTANDGSKLELTAGNGDYDSVLVTVTSSDGKIQSFTQPWSVWHDQLRDKASYNYWFFLDP